MEQDQLTLIQDRRRKVEQELATLREALQALERELPELEMAERVILRLSSAGPTVSGATQDVAPLQAKSIRRKDKRTLPEMITAVLNEKLAQGVDGLEPKDAAPIIRERWDTEVTGTYVSTTFWRMWKNNLLQKDEGSALYRLPKKKEPADDSLAGKSASSLFD